MKITALNLLIGLNLLTFSCNSPTVKDGAPLDVAAYKLEIEKWHEKRQVDLKAEDGWLNLVGLFWLKEGSNSFGSGDKNDIVFPAGKIPLRAGSFIVNQGIVSIEVAPATEITQRGKPLSNGIIFSPDSVSNAKLEYGSLRWFIIQRDKIVGIRLRDLESEDVQKFNGIEHYPIDPAWRIEATVETYVEPYVEPKMIDITNVLGQTTSQASQGTVVFTINETAYRLDALDGGKDELFVIFGDYTNKKETYPAGRYIYIKRPDETNRTIIDFNKAYNPPCAFTAFATCPLPPKQNILNVEIPAGEKNYSGPEHETH